MRGDDRYGPDIGLMLNRPTRGWASDVQTRGARSCSPASACIVSSPLPSPEISFPPVALSRARSSPVFTSLFGSCEGAQSKTPETFRGERNDREAEGLRRRSRDAAATCTDEERLNRRRGRLPRRRCVPKRISAVIAILFFWIPRFLGFRCHEFGFLASCISILMYESGFLPSCISILMVSWFLAGPGSGGERNGVEVVPLPQPMDANLTGNSGRIDSFAGGKFVLPNSSSFLGFQFVSWTDMFDQSDGGEEASLPSGNDEELAAEAGQPQPPLDQPFAAAEDVSHGGGAFPRKSLQKSCYSSSSVRGFLDFDVASLVSWHLAFRF